MEKWKFDRYYKEIATDHLKRNLQLIIRGLLKVLGFECLSWEIYHETSNSYSPRNCTEFPE